MRPAVERANDGFSLGVFVTECVHFSVDRGDRKSASVIGTRGRPFMEYILAAYCKVIWVNANPVRSNFSYADKELSRI